MFSSLSVLPLVVFFNYRKFIFSHSQVKILCPSIYGCFLLSIMFLLSILFKIVPIHPFPHDPQCLLYSKLFIMLGNYSHWVVISDPCHISDLCPRWLFKVHIYTAVRCEQMFCFILETV